MNKEEMICIQNGVNAHRRMKVLILCVDNYGGILHYLNRVSGLFPKHSVT